MNQEVKYSICIPNRNMENTIEVALRSVLDQIDVEYEVIVVDDGSTDRSVEILKSLELEYSNLYVHELPRDPKRILAETRNISISFARGQYLLLHIDCDDYWYPYIKDFVKIYHQIEKFKGSQFLLSGHQLNMGEAHFLRSHGPYKSGHMVEDRDMWFRLARIGAYIPLDHVVFRERMKLTKKQRFRKIVHLNYIILSDEIRVGRTLRNVILDIVSDKSTLSRKYRAFKVLIFPGAWLRARLKGPLAKSDYLENWSTLKSEAWLKSGTAAELFRKAGKYFDESALTEAGKWIFSHSARFKTMKDLPEKLKG